MKQKLLKLWQQTLNASSVHQKELGDGSTQTMNAAVGL